jgi:large subunit ribosomal protein L22
VSGEQGIDLDVDSLYVKQALANDGPRMKRIRPAPMGRAYRYQRRLTHIVVSVAERDGGSAHLVTRAEDPESKPAKKTAAKKAATKTAKKAPAKKPVAKKKAGK